MAAPSRCACAVCALGVAIVAAPCRAQDAVPPSVVSSAPVECPEDTPSCDDDTEVAMRVLVERDGSLGAIDVDDDVEPSLEASAMAAVRSWRFEPARRAGDAVRARVRVVVRFRAGVEPVAPPPSAPAEDEPDVLDEDDARASYSATGTVDPILETTVPRSTSDVVISEAQVHGAPRRDGGDVLAAAPGVYVARGEGDGVANAIAVRGFDADHGQDVELTLSGVPLNAPSHVHGQGYTDLGFVLPEVLSSVRVTEGVHDPHQGDFAIAGSIDLGLGVAHRGLSSRTSYGSFGTFRESLVWAPPGEREATFAGGALRFTNGFGGARGGEQATLIAQSESVIDRVRLRFLGVLHASRYGLAGVIRYDDVGAVGFYGAYDDPAAADQMASSTRALAATTASLALDHGSFVEGMIWGGYTDFLLRANYTGYASAGDVRGDRFQQTDEAFTVGLGGRWRSERATIVDGFHGWLEVGARGRFDARAQTHGLATAPDVVWQRSIDADVHALDVGVFADLDIHIADIVRLRGGVRGEVFAYDVIDHLSTAHVSPLGAVAGPRASIEIRAARGVTLAASYGEGFRSPQAQPLLHLSDLPIARVRTGDLGARFASGDHDELSVQVTGFVSALSNDLVFEADEGSLTNVGPSTRVGASMHLATHPISWLRGLVSATYVHATLDQPPPGMTGEYVAGEALPYLPPLVVRAEASADEEVARIADLPLRVRASAGFSFLSPRPLPYQDVARAVGLLDVSAGIAWGNVDLGIDVFNALDQRYAALEYSMPASWTPSAAPVTQPSRAFSAGAPLTVMATLGVRVE